MLYSHIKKRKKRKKASLFACRRWFNVNMGKENGQIEGEEKKREGGRNDEGNHEANN